MAIKIGPTGLGLALLASLSLQGCTYGFLYSDTVVPVDRNMTRTLLGSTSGSEETKQLQDPFVTGVKVEWGSRAIGDAAKRTGVEQIEFADMHTISVLGGLYKSSTIIVYGKSDGSLKETPANSH